ncbi:MAG: type VI-B CRISPR-associated RNA-guided ribonuclease Cas13b [Candidatus Cryptobacteroides sp.]
MAHNHNGYPKPLNIIVKENVLPDSAMLPIWAAYFNMARYNMYTTLIHIAAATGLSDDENKENRMDLMRVLNEAVDPEVELSLRRLICIHFPFVNWMCTAHGSDRDADVEYEDLMASLQDLRDCLKTITFTLNHYRNLYSHSRTIETRSEDIIAKSRKSERRTGLYLKKICTISARRVKTRFSDKDNRGQAGMIDEGSLKFITEGKVIIKAKMMNGKPVLDKNGRKTRESKDNPNYFLNPLVLDPNGVMKDGTNPERLSTVGKMQFVCLLLEKKYITEFLTRSRFLDAFKGDAPAPRLSDRRLILEVLSDLRIRMPKKKIDSTRNDIQVALDMLNELKKCPDELFDLLGPEDRASFSIESTTGETFLLRRSSDRFTQLALQWFDADKSLIRIRFQLNAGVFRYLFNESKTCLDGKTRLRVLQEPLNCFGRVQEVEEKRISHRDGKGGPWAGFKIKGFDDAVRNDKDSLPYINDAGTRYLVDGDNIGIRFGEDGESSGDYIPAINPGDGRYRVNCRPAQCTMSIYELPAMLFLHLLDPGNEGEPAPVEKIIIDNVEAFRRLFTDIRNGKLTPKGQDTIALDAELSTEYGIALNEVPEKLRDYLLGKVDDRSGFRAYRTNLIKKLKEDTDRRVQRLRDDLEAMCGDMNKPGKPRFVQLRPGSLASFIAKDIVFFQEGNADQKMTGLNFSVMQGLIATFGSRDGATADDLKSAFRSAGLIAANGACGTHPFLAVAFNAGANNTVTLYREYLKARQAYLSGNIPETAAFLHSDRMKWAERNDSFYREYAGRCLERPVMLPRRIFESAIRARLLSLEGKNADTLKEVIREAGDRCNSAYMIDSYFFYVKDDNPQVFHGACEGDMDHTFGHRFFQIVRKNVNTAEFILAGLRKDKEKSHRTYIDALTMAIDWAKKNPLPKPATRVIGPKTKVLTREETAAMIKRAFNEFTATEKTLRRYTVQDEVLFMAAMKTIENTIAVKGNNAQSHYAQGKEWKLGSIGPRTESVLNTVIPSVKTDVMLNGAVQFTIEQRDVTLMDYGDIYRLLADRRIADLLKYHNGDVVQASDLKKELDAYDNRRVGVFKDIMDYERKVTSGIKNRQLCDSMPKAHSKTVDFKVMQLFDDNNDELTKVELRTIRNAFCHNSYPDKEVKSPDGTRSLHKAEVPGTADTVSDRIRTISRNTKNPS